MAAEEERCHLGESRRGSVDGSGDRAPARARYGLEDDINRPVVVHRADGYHMWYTGQAHGTSRIGYARSRDGRDWVRQSSRSVLESALPWEGVAVMCPHVIWDDRERVWKMWYSGGEQYEPNAIGHATSTDGLQWTKHPGNPVLVPVPGSAWEQERVTAAQIIPLEGWYYAFYIGFRDVDHAQIGLARSKDGITHWIRHPENPIVRPTPDGWDADACYKPYALYSEGQWRLWYNGRHKALEQIGLATHDGKDLGFQADAAIGQANRGGRTGCRVASDSQRPCRAPIRQPIRTTRARFRALQTLLLGIHGR